MEKGKKMFAILLSAVLTVSALGCGGAAGEERQNGGKEQENATVQSGTTKDAQKSAGDEASEGGSVTSMGRYMENSFSLPDGAMALRRTMAFLEDGRLAYFDGESGLHFSEDEGKSWKDKKSLEEVLPGHGYISHSAIAPDGSLAVCEGVYYDDGTSEHKVVCVKADGTQAEADGAVLENDFIHKVFFGPDSNLYAVSLHGKVYTMDKTSGELKQLFAATEGAEVLAFTGKLLLTLEEGGVEIFNLETKALQDSDSVLDDFCREHLAGKLGNNSDSVGGYLLGAQEGIVYLACREGLYRHVLGGNAMEQLIEGSFSAFGDPTKGICNVFLLESGEFLLLTTRDELIRFTYDPNEPTIPEKQLKVYSLEENSKLRQTISAYQKEYPDVYVNYEVGITEGSAVTKMDALKNLNLVMVGGDGPDVLLLDDIDVSAYAEKGMLKDLSGILEELTGENAVFENIAGAYRTERGVFALPAGFLLPLIIGKAEDVDAVTDLVTLADVVEKLSAGLKNATVTGAKTPEQELSQLFATCSPSWLSGRELNEAALQEFLTQAKRMYEADKTGLTPEFLERFGNYDGSVPLGNRTNDIMLGIGKIAFGNAKMMLADIGGIGYFMEEEEGYSFKLWSGQSGTGFVPVNKLAISAQTGRSEEAENFVRLMFSENVQSVSVGDCFPVSRAAFDALCEWQDQSIAGSWENPDGVVMWFGNGWPGKETAAGFKKLVEQADTCLEGNSILEDAVMKYGPQVLTGVMSVEDGVREIKKAVAIYLSEQG